MAPAATTQSGGLRLRSPPWMKTCLGTNSSFCSLCPSRPNPPLPHVYTLPTVSTATQCVWPATTLATLAPAALNASTAVGTGCGW